MTQNYLTNGLKMWIQKWLKYVGNGLDTWDTALYLRKGKNGLKFDVENGKS